MRWFDPQMSQRDTDGRPRRREATPLIRPRLVPSGAGGSDYSGLMGSDLQDTDVS